MQVVELTLKFRANVKVCRLMAFSADSGALKKNARIPSLTPIFCETFLDTATFLIAMMIFRNGLEVPGISQPRGPRAFCVGHN